jgi:hypothetical protein
MGRYHEYALFYLIFLTATGFKVNLPCDMVHEKKNKKRTNRGRTRCPLPLPS